VSTAIPSSNIAATGPLTRGDLLLMLYWFSDRNVVPQVLGIAGLSRLTRLALILGKDTGLDRTIDPYFSFHATPGGGIGSVDVWTELLGLRAYQVVTPLTADEPMPPEELAERRHMLDKYIPAHERSHYPLPTALERDVLTNKGTFFAAKREDQMVGRQLDVFKRVVDLARLPMADLTARALPHLGVPAAR
jgi:hypothetical protein